LGPLGNLLGLTLIPLLGLTTHVVKKHPSIRKAFGAGLVVGLGHLLFGFSGTVGRPRDSLNEEKMVEILIQEK